MRTLTETTQVIICSLVIAAVAIWLPYYQSEAGALLDQYDFSRSLLWQEPWRILTAHVFHINARHALYNAAGLVVVTVLFARHFSVRTWINAVLIIATTSSVTVWLIAVPERFVGLSGLIHGLLVMSLLLEWSKQQYQFRDWLSPLALGLIFIKVTLEIAGRFASEILLSQGHQFGYVHAAGVLGGIIAWRLHRRRLATLTLASKSQTTENNDENTKE